MFWLCVQREARPWQRTFSSLGVYGSAFLRLAGQSAHSEARRIFYSKFDEEVLKEARRGVEKEWLSRRFPTSKNPFSLRVDARLEVIKSELTPAESSSTLSNCLRVLNQDDAERWSTHQVLGWLTHEGFSAEWKTTFSELDPFKKMA